MSRFAKLLADYQRRSGQSQRQVAVSAGLDPGRYSRLLNGEREPASREQVLALTSALHLDRTQADRLVAAAGYLPPSLANIGLDDPVITAVLTALTRTDLDEPAQAALRQTILNLINYWHSAPPAADKPAHGH